MSSRYPRTIKGDRWYAEQNHEFRTYSQAQWERDHPPAGKNEPRTAEVDASQEPAAPSGERTDQ